MSGERPCCHNSRASAGAQEQGRECTWAKNGTPADLARGCPEVTPGSEQIQASRHMKAVLEQSYYSHAICSEPLFVAAAPLSQQESLLLIWFH